MVENKTKNEKVEKKEERKSALKKIAGVMKVKKEPKEEEPKKIIEDPFGILKFVLMTEKSVNMIEAQNKLVFIVDRRSTKDEIKNASETAFQTPIVDVKTMIDQKGRKKAFIKFKEPGQAGEIAIRLGII